MPDGPFDVVVDLGAGDVLVGRLFSSRRRGGESASFSYDEAFIAHPAAYPVDPLLPLVQGAQHTVDVPLFRAFADSAPDRWGRGLIARAERRAAERETRAQRSLGEIDYLLGVRDDLRQGALRFRDGRGFLAPADRGVPQLTELGRLLDLAARHEADEVNDDDIDELLRVGSSLGGARPKAHVRAADGNVAIAKFPSSRHDTWNVMAWEKVALDLAASTGIRVPASQLLRIGGRSVLVIDRFDRDGERRIGYVSALTMLEASDGQRASYVDIAAVIEQVARRASDDLEELWRRIAFGVLISNTDDHLRNHGFLHDGGSSWRLSPAFDLNPNPEPGPTLLATEIAPGDSRASIESALAVAPLFRLRADQALAQLRGVFEATARWRQVAGLHGLDAREQNELAWAFEHPERDRARTLLGL